MSEQAGTADLQATLNFRDLMMVKGSYNPKLKLPPGSTMCVATVQYDGRADMHQNFYNGQSPGTPRLMAEQRSRLSVFKR